MLRQSASCPWKLFAALILLMAALAGSEASQGIAIDLRSVVNVGLKDEYDGDRQGGWTDQGENDMRNFPVGEQVFRGIPFTIIDPETNDGKAALVMYGKERPYFPKTARIPLNIKAKTIYFLHTAAWCPPTGTKVADYWLEYADGERIAIPIAADVDLTNWWNPYATENSVVGWVGSNPIGKVVGTNLYWLKNPRPDKELKDLVIEATGSGVLCILGITASGEEPSKELLMPQESSYDTGDWFPFELSWNQIPVKGSAVDRSFLLDAPAGKHGFLGVEGDKFVFEDGTIAKFWGVNISATANFPTHEQAEVIAKRLAAYGFNMVRLHHMDSGLFKENIFDNNYNDTQHFDEEVLDRLDYFIYCLKQEGIYIYLDQRVTRHFKEGDNIGIDLSADPQLKGYTYFVQRLIELQKKYSRDLWHHYNPYTKLRYCDDPAIALTEITNEDDLFTTRSKLLKIDEFAAILTDKWNAWRQKRGLERADIPTDIDLLNHSLFVEFANDLQAEFYREMIDYQRKIGVKVPIAGTNWSSWIQDQPSQVVCDFIDTHVYWDHPSNSAIANKPMLKSSKTALDMMGFSAQHNKPFFISEWGHPWPNSFRAEATAWTAAISALQGWDGLTLYTYRHSADPNIRYINGNFNRFNDPAYMGLMPIASMLYYRGDVQQANSNYVIRYTHKDLYDSHPLSKYTQYYQGAVEISSYRNIFGEAALADGAVELFLEETVKPSLRQSDTGEIRRDVQRGLLTISTSGTEVVQGFTEGEKVQLSVLAVQTENDFAVFALSSVDTDELKAASRYLLTAVARAENTGTVYTIDRRRVLDQGTEPVIVEPVVAEIELLLDGKLKVWALDEMGLRRAQVPVEDNRFKIDGSYETIWFEIIRQ